MVIRVGKGQTPSGKILDRNTHWYTDKNNAIEYIIKNHKEYDIYISVNNKAYRKITLKELRNL